MDDKKTNEMMAKCEEMKDDKIKIAAERLIRTLEPL